MKKKIDMFSVVLVIVRILCVIMSILVVPAVLITAETGNNWYLWTYIIVGTILVPLVVGMGIYDDEREKEA